MKHRFALPLYWLLTALLLTPAAAQPAPQPPNPDALARGIDAVLRDSLLDNAFWSVMVVDLETDHTLYRRNAEKSFVPASNVKLYTSAAALDQLGPGYRYRTDLYLGGPVVGGVLQGPLIVRGSGDPVIGGRFNDGDRTEVFRAWADSLRRLGIRSVDGDVIGDDDRFDDVPLGQGWSWDDLAYWYTAEISALSFNDNCVDVTIESQQPGMPGVVRWEPEGTDYVSVTNATRTIAAGAELDEGYARPPGTNHLHLSSLVPQGRTDRESLSVSNPTRYFVHVLRESLLRAGLAVAGRPVDVDDLSLKPRYDALPRAAVHVSPPLADIIEEMNKESQNLYAEQLLKTLAAERPPADTSLVPGSAEAGVAAATETFVRAGIDTSRIHLVDGSGLSRYNLVTGEATAALLRYMWTHPDPAVRAAFLQSLPIGGEDGTLRFRYSYGPARGNVRAKTGTISSVSTLSGYVTTPTGKPLAFVLMCNHFTADTDAARAAQDAIVNLLARYGS